MKNLKRFPVVIIATFYFLLFTFDSSAQNIGINSTGAEPDPSALLDLSSEDKGFLITRVDTAEIASPAFGLMTLSPKDSCLYMYGKHWISIGGVGEECIIIEESPFICGDSFTDERDNSTYGSVQIEEQCWMSENLNFETTSGSSCYGNDQSNCDNYGRLYQYDAIMDGAASSDAVPSGVQGICPTGWHVPSDSEWKKLEMALGMTASQANTSGWRGGNEGTKLKSETLWPANQEGTNESGFTGIPGGKHDGTYSQLGTDAYFRTSTESASNAYVRRLANGNNVARFAVAKTIGYSLRCVMD